ALQGRPLRGALDGRAVRDRRRAEDPAPALEGLTDQGAARRERISEDDESSRNRLSGIAVKNGANCAGSETSASKHTRPAASIRTATRNPQPRSAISCSAAAMRASSPP